MRYASGQEASGTWNNGALTTPDAAASEADQSTDPAAEETPDAEAGSAGDESN
jgi:hypothetical protein